MKLSQTNGPLYQYYGDDLRATLAHLKDAGFRYVDISFFTRYVKGSRYFTTDNAILADEYRRALETLELVPVQSHEPSGNILGDDGGAYYYKKSMLAIDLAGRIGIPSITLHPGVSDKMEMSREKYVETLAERFMRLIPLAEKYGIRLLIENLPWKSLSADSMTSNADELNELLDRIDHPLFGICWDTGHANMLGLDQYKEIKKLGTRLEGVHLHDNYAHRLASGQDLHHMPFWGDVNYDAVITALLEVGYKGTFNFEVDAPGMRNDRIPFAGEEKISMLSPAIRLQTEKLLYRIGKHMLETYHCFEE